MFALHGSKIQSYRPRAFMSSNKKQLYCVLYFQELSVQCVHGTGFYVQSCHTAEKKMEWNNN